MKIRAYVLYGILLAAAAAVAIAAGDRGKDDERASVESNGPHGLRALYLYLEQSGRAGSILDSWDAAKMRPDSTVVIAAPTAREISADEVKTLESFVRAGGSLVYLVPRSFGAQPEMDTWLGLSRGKWLAGESTTSPDARAKVWIPLGPLAGVHDLVVARDAAVQVDSADAVPVAGQPEIPVLWRKTLDKGELWIAPGPDLASNARIGQGDNLAFWDHLAQRGPLLFDERHQVAATQPPMSGAALALVAQFLLMGLVFAWSRGVRLGPPRMPPQVRHRASREYLAAFAGLLRRAHVEGELAHAMHQRLRKLIHERMGVAVSLPDEDAARAVASASEIRADELIRVLRDLRDAAQSTLTPKMFLELSRRCAELEDRIEGRRSASRQAA